jgi:hypothetical protein
MSYRIVAEYTSIYQCICGRAEHTIQKRPGHVSYIDSDGYLGEIREKCCAIDDFVHWNSEEYMIIYKDDTELTTDNYTAYNLRQSCDRTYRIIISLLTRKNKEWIYNSLRYDISLYTSKLPSDILRIILDFI